MDILSQILAAAALLAGAVIYGTDVFCAIVQRPALAQVSDGALTSVMGRVHEYGDRRLPLPGVIGLVAAALAAITAGIAGHAVAAVAAAVAVAAQVVWLAIYLRIDGVRIQRFTDHRFCLPKMNVFLFTEVSHPQSWQITEVLKATLRRQRHDFELVFEQVRLVGDLEWPAIIFCTTNND